MRSFFSRSPDLEGGRAYKKGFTGDHRGRSYIPPNPSPLFSPQSQLDPFDTPSVVYRHDTIFKPPPSPSPKSVTFSDRSWSAPSASRTGTGKLGNGATAGVLDKGQLDKDQLDRLHEYLGVLPAGGVPHRAKRGFSMSDPNDRPVHVSAPIPLSPQARIKKNLKQKAAEHHFRRNQQQSGHSHDALLGEEQEQQVRYQTHLFKEALKTALSVHREEPEFQEFAAGSSKGPVMQRRGASEGMREGGFVGPLPVEMEEELLPKDLAEFLEKYDPRSEDLPDVYPMGEHRAMLRTMYLEDILYSTAKLHKHNWILLSRNEKYKDLRIPERWDQIQEDLEKYTRSIRNYEYWLTSLIPPLSLSKSSFPPRFHLYGKQLAILEAAKSYNNPLEQAFAHELERKLVAYHTDWSLNSVVFRGLRRDARKRGWRRGNGPFVRWAGRVLGGVLGGGALLAPVGVLVLWPGGVGRVGGVGVVGVSVAVVGLVVAWGMDGGEEGRSGWEGAEGVRDRNARAGVGGRGRGGEWGMWDVMLVLAAYAAVLVIFLGVAIV
ncbi:hypothetical protein SBOR_7373 [Sclerotinia borealis F-4128]|uniref:Uncharacterized protein n=1 Tax=Sclerotinia borealis (strain F-4128) TaxID=1432307 RepID=W9C655_SCLBF|nr:hypothetical protein SBOR_7373 [Sclerotinia borealis F-4128]